MPRWTPEARRKQAEIQKTRQSWRHSTGPKTPEGKARSAMNAWKHGMRSRPAATLRAALRRHSRLLDHINACIYARRRAVRSGMARHGAHGPPNACMDNSFPPLAPGRPPPRE